MPPLCSLERELTRPALADGDHQRSQGTNPAALSQHQQSLYQLREKCAGHTQARRWPHDEDTRVTPRTGRRRYQQQGEGHYSRTSHGTMAPTEAVLCSSFFLCLPVRVLSAQRFPPNAPSWTKRCPSSLVSRGLSLTTSSFAIKRKTTGHSGSLQA